MVVAPNPLASQAGLAVLRQGGSAIDAAIALANFGSRNGATELESGTTIAELKLSLENLGHRVQVMDLNSGLHGITVNPDGLRGGVDPRREGLAIGD